MALCKTDTITQSVNVKFSEQQDSNRCRKGDQICIHLFTLWVRACCIYCLDSFFVLLLHAEDVFFVSVDVIIKFNQNLYLIISSHSCQFIIYVVFNLEFKKTKQKTIEPCDGKLKLLHK